MGDGTSIVCRVRWKALWASLAKFITIAITVPLAGLMVIRFFSSGFDVGKTFDPLSPATTALLFLGIAAFGIAFAFPIALLYSLAPIKVADGVISGRNFWGFKNRIPLSDIVAINRFDNNGIKAFVVASKSHGEVYIYDHTEHLPELLHFLESFLPKNQSANGIPI